MGFEAFICDSWDAVERSRELIREFFEDGFWTLMVLALVCPWLGTLLVLRRMPLLALAVPQMASCGEGLAFVLAAKSASDLLEAPEQSTRTLAALGAVAAGLALIAFLSRRGRSIGVAAGILFLLSIGLRDIFFLGERIPRRLRRDDPPW